MSRALFFLLFWSISVANAQDVLTLEECIASALSANPGLQIDKLEKERARQNTSFAKEGYYPSLNGSADHNYNIGRSVDPFTNQIVENEVVRSNSFFVSTQVPIFQGFQVRRTIAEQKLREQAAETNVQASLNAIALNVSEAYVNTLIQQEQIRIAQGQLLALQDQLELVEKQFDAGTQTRDRLAVARADLLNQRSQLVQVQNLYQQQLFNLLVLCNLPFEKNYTLQELPLALEDTVLPLPSEMVSYAESNLPELQNAKLGREASLKTIEVNKAAIYPTLNFQGSIFTNFSSLADQIEQGPTRNDTLGFAGSAPIVIPSPSIIRSDFPFLDQLDNNLRYGLSFSLNIPIYNRGTVRNQIAQAKINAMQAEFQLVQTRLQVKSEIYQAYNEALAAKKRFVASREASEAYQIALDLSNKQYKAGQLAFYDLQAVRRQQQQAQTQEVVNRYQFYYNKTVLQFYTGKDARTLFSNP